MEKFTLTEFRRSLQTLTSPGELQKIIKKMYGKVERHRVHDGEYPVILQRMIAIIDSMTATEIEVPEIISTERSKRIAVGSGTSTNCVSDLLLSFKDMRDTLDQHSNWSNMNTLAPGRDPR